MLKIWMHNIVLAVQARSGATTALLAWLGIVAVASFTAFIFLCVATYDWLSLQLGAIIAGLVMAGIFASVALVGVLVCAFARRRAKERAIIERAARAHAPSWLFDPQILATAVQVGRSLGWQRIVPIALLGLITAQWAREYREHGHRSSETS